MFVTANRISRAALRRYREKKSFIIAPYWPNSPPAPVKGASVYGAYQEKRGLGMILSGQIAPQSLAAADCSFDNLGFNAMDGRWCFSVDLAAPYEVDPGNRTKR